jgi:hypothetical protein
MAPTRMPRRSGVATGLGNVRIVQSFERAFVSLK